MGLIGKARGMQGAVKPVAAAIAGENSARAVAAMSGRRQTHDKNPRRRIAESWQGPGPIPLPLVPERGILCHLLAPAHQPRTFATGDNRFVELSNTIHGPFC